VLKNASALHSKEKREKEEKNMNVAIFGYGNLGRGVECAVKCNPDVYLIGVFTRRSPESVKTVTGVPV
jgi:diaminopimelate dehydrogenase